jgi:hypothetical protein
MLAVVYQADRQVQKAVQLLKHGVTIGARVLRNDRPSQPVSLEVPRHLHIEVIKKNLLPFPLCMVKQHSM